MLECIPESENYENREEKIFGGLNVRTARKEAAWAATGTGSAAKPGSGSGGEPARRGGEPRSA